MKTNKHLTLQLASRQKGVRPSYLGRQGLLERIGAGYVLTERGLDRLQYFEVAGCANPVCPLCQGKAGYLTCPSCGYQIPKQKAKILKERDFFFVVRHLGVYCPRCLKLIFSEAQARLLGIRAEA